MWTRRRFLGAGGAAIAGGVGAYGYAKYVEPHWLEITRHELPLENLPAALDGATLAHISDLHVGNLVDSEYLVDVLERTAALEPEVVAFTGDFITNGASIAFEKLARVLRHWPQGRLATVAALGNHDYGKNWKQPEVAAAVQRRAHDAGITVLRNATLDVEGLQIAGLDDLWGTNFNPLRALDKLDPDRASLVLCHNPDAADRPIWRNFRGWILSGHTHGGQCKPPFLPPPILPVLNRRYTAGEFALTGRRTMYISRGVGHLLKARFNVRPEVTLFTLLPKGGKRNTSRSA